MIDLTNIFLLPSSYLWTHFVYAFRLRIWLRISFTHFVYAFRLHILFTHFVTHFCYRFGHIQDDARTSGGQRIRWPGCPTGVKLCPTDRMDQLTLSDQRYFVSDRPFLGDFCRDFNASFPVKIPSWSNLTYLKINLNLCVCLCVCGACIFCLFPCVCVCCGWSVNVHLYCVVVRALTILSLSWLFYCLMGSQTTAHLLKCMGMKRTLVSTVAKLKVPLRTDNSTTPIATTLPRKSNSKHVINAWLSCTL